LNPIAGHAIEVRSYWTASSELSRLASSKTNRSAAARCGVA
jgi:hypothetical protein